MGEMENAVRWGILSTANIGRAAVIPAIEDSTNGEVVAVASRERSRAEEFAAANSIPNAYGTYQELLDDGHVDALYIPLPNNMHREWTIRAAEAGKHVLCEKPLALNGRECDEMLAAATSAGVVSMEAFMYRFHPRIARILELLGQGVIGERSNRCTQHSRSGSRAPTTSGSILNLAVGR